MTPRIRREYRRLRALNWTASDALRCARVKDEFERMEAEGLVRLDIQPDDDMRAALDMDYPNERIRKEVADRANREGAWILLGQYKDVDDEWIDADSVGGFIGEDWQDSGYDTDIMETTLERFFASRKGLVVDA